MERREAGGRGGEEGGGEEGGPVTQALVELKSLQTHLVLPVRHYTFHGLRQHQHCVHARLKAKTKRNT